ncbi:MAG: TrkA C-terminal domain-containing protein [Armatimonadota bacterium]
MTWLIELLKSNPLLLLILVVAVGFVLGQIKIAGVQLGVAMVLFVGIGVGSLDPGLKLPDLIYFLGLSLFVYTVGLSSAPSFFRALNRQGLRQSGLAVGSLLVSFGSVWVLGRHFGLSGGIASTVFSGSLTNAPALASALDTLRSGGMSETQLAPVVAGYAISYPPGILIPLLLIPLFRKLTGVNLKEEAKTIPAHRLMSEKIEAFTVRVTDPSAVGLEVRQIAGELGNAFTFGRRRREGVDEVVTSRTTFELGDLVSVIGSDSQAQRVASRIGEMTDVHLEHDREQLDFRRVIVSNTKIAGRALSELKLAKEFGAVITRVKRGDFEFIPTGETVLQLGDRVRVLARREQHEAVSKFLGDKPRGLMDADLASLGLGMLLGLLIGEIPLPAPGGATFKLGFAGGPLLVALVLGRLQRTGPIIWNISHTANATLRQFGLAIFAAGVGLKSGYQFSETLHSGAAVPMLIAGVASSLACGLVVLFWGFYVMKIPLNTLFGVYAAAQTQPVTLAFSVGQTGNELPATAYATSSPFATVFKIVAANLLLTMLK